MAVPKSPDQDCDSATPVKNLQQKCPLSSKPVKLKVEVKSYFRILQPDGTLTPDGKGKNTEQRRIGRFLDGVLDAEVELSGQKTSITGNTVKGKKNKTYASALLDITTLEDGIYTLHVKPPPSRKSDGPAGPATPGQKAKKTNDLEARTYRPVDVSVRIECGKAVEAKVPSKVNYANAWVKGGPSDTVFVDLKPVWWSSPSPKCKARKKDKDPDLIVLHNTGAIGEGNAGLASRELKAALNQAFTSWCAHYYVDLDGHVVKIFHEDKTVAFHAMYTWEGENTNDRSVGIEICRPIEGFQLREGGSVKELAGLRKAQFDSVVRLIEDLQKAYDIPKYRLIGHCDSQKESCPGCDFWWELLEKLGQGMVLQEPAPTEEPSEYTKWFKNHTHINKKADAEVIGLINQDLEDIGYEIKPKKPKPGYINQWSQLTTKAVKRFQYHFYSGARYHLRFEYTGKPKKLKDKGVWDKNSEDGGKAGGKVGQATPGEADCALARRIRAVADYVRKAKAAS